MPERQVNHFTEKEMGSIGDLSRILRAYSPTIRLLIIQLFWENAADRIGRALFESDEAKDFTINHPRFSQYLRERIPEEKRSGREQLGGGTGMVKY